MTSPFAAPQAWPIDAAPDILVFEVTDTTLNLVGGQGRGLGWSGIVELGLEAEPVAWRVNRTGRIARLGDAGEPVHVIGPYWAKHALVIPVGSDHVVVFGAPEPIRASEATLVPAAAQIVAGLQQVAPAKLLSDELEVVHAIRELMDHRPEQIASTARHIADRAAEALSCEVGAVLVRSGDRAVVEVVTRDWPGTFEADAIRDTLIRLETRATHGAVVEAELRASIRDAFGRSAGLVTRLAIPIGRPESRGVLVVAHAAVRPRGFTNLCRRIGNALADAADSLLAQAISREELAAERDQFAREARQDPLTGLENRVAWEELMRHEESRHERYPGPVAIVSADLDNLKAVNDRHGHLAGDALIRAAADLLRSHARVADRIARVGGDEFLVLLPETDAAGAERFIARVRDSAAGIQLDDDATLSLSVGLASAEPNESLSSVLRRADAAMYASKLERRGLSRRGGNSDSTA